MSLSTEVMIEMKKAMKAKDQNALTSLRAIKSAILLAQTETGTKEEITQEQELKLLQKLVKQRMDSATIFTEQGRDDLAGRHALRGRRELSAGDREGERGRGFRGSLGPPGPFFTHLDTVYMEYSKCLPTLLNPLAQRTYFSQMPDAQEVFIDTVGEGSLTLELLERCGRPSL